MFIRRIYELLPSKALGKPPVECALLSVVFESMPLVSTSFEDRVFRQLFESVIHRKCSKKKECVIELPIRNQTMWKR